jgi:ATP-binding cassette subfamily B protein
MDCGPTCLRMIAKFYGKHFNLEGLRNTAGFNKDGVSLLGISDAAEKIGFRTRGVQLTLNQVIFDAQLPCILHWNQNHFVVLLPGSKINQKTFFSFFKKYNIIIADPANGIIKYSTEEFKNKWATNINKNGDSIGTALLLDPSPEFYLQKDEVYNKLSWNLLLQYLHNCKLKFAQVLITLLITSFFQLIFPFLTQSIVDIGINTQNLQYLNIVLIAQLMLVFSKTIIEFIRSRLLLYISATINLSILSDFWIKITKLPLNYFDSHHTGDTLQRLSDHKQIQNFLTGNTLYTFFNFFNFFIFSYVLVQYNIQIFFVFILGSILYYFWIYTFLSFRRKLNYQTFHISAKENNATLQLIQGMQEIRLHNAEKLKRWEWENIQAQIFKLNLKSLTYSQVQQAGALIINQGKDILISFFVAKLVIEGKLTLGAMLAIQYIIGQLQGPIENMINFVQSFQDAKISMERLNEVHQLENEEQSDINYLKHLPFNKSISFKNLSFIYPGSGNEPVLKNINLEIPEGKVTAVVGVSGSGKTTLIKLLLKYFDEYEGDILIGETNYKYISPSFWRKNTGAVLQDGYIFKDSIANNIGISDEAINYNKLIKSCKIANILTFIESLPNGFNTLLGTEGVGISQGQKQRLLIARAIYKNPEYIFLDESTNALDANNEKVIVENLQDYYKGKTVIIVAHRLSTVKNADKIVVLQKGTIVEEGSHDKLCSKKGIYYDLVKNQLELGL